MGIELKKNPCLPVEYSYRMRLRLTRTRLSVKGTGVNAERYKAFPTPKPIVDKMLSRRNYRRHGRTEPSAGKAISLMQLFSDVNEIAPMLKSPQRRANLAMTSAGVQGN